LLDPSLFSGGVRTYFRKQAFTLSKAIDQNGRELKGDQRHRQPATAFWLGKSEK
jgi:hypothetical protein